MPILIDTEKVPSAERLERYQAVLAGQPMPLTLEPPLPDRFASQLNITAFGPLAVGRVVQGIDGVCEIVRSPKLIRQADPEIYRLMINLRGHNVMVQDGREAVLGVGDMAIYDSSRPFVASRVPGAGFHHDFLMLTFPRSLCAVSPNVIRAATSVRLPSDRGLGALVLDFAQRLVCQTEEYALADAARLSTTFLDLVAIWLSREFDTAPTLPVRSRREVLFMQVQTYIVQHLDDHALSPGTIAAAHHISPRTLHMLFEAHGLTVAGWIRDRRLDGCRRNLADPNFDHLPIAAIGARWGLIDAAHFSRTFRGAYGVSPREYRRLCQLTRTE